MTHPIQDSPCVFTNLKVIAGCEFLGLCSSAIEVTVLLRCVAALLGDLWLVFWDNVFVSSSRIEYSWTFQSLKVRCIAQWCSTTSKKNADLFAISFSMLCILFDPSYWTLAVCMTFPAFINVYGSLLSQNFLTFAVSQYIEVSVSGYEIWFKFYYFYPQCLGLNRSWTIF
jgi:hypothetical protein